MTIPKLGIHSIKINHKTRTLCRSFVAPRYSQALLGMPDICILAMLTINFNTVDTKPSTEQTNRKQADRWYCASRTQGKMQDALRQC